MVFSAGMTPRIEGKLVFRGEVGSEVSLEEARQAAALAAGNALTAIQANLPDGVRMAACLLLTVYIRASLSFENHSLVADAASDVVCESTGSQGIGARVAVGVMSLPGGAPVEVQIVAQVAPAGRGAAKPVGRHLNWPMSPRWSRPWCFLRPSPLISGSKPMPSDKGRTDRRW